MDMRVLDITIGFTKDRRLQALNREWVQVFSQYTQLRRQLRQLNLTPEYRAELELHVRAHEQSLGEKFHCNIEIKAQPILAELRQQSDTFYQDPCGCDTFLSFICNQFFRTQKTQHIITHPRIPIDGYDPRRTHVIEAIIFSNNVSMALFRERTAYGISFLINETKSPFVTSDQPITNMLDWRKTEDIEFYYPLSPKLAMLYTKDAQKRSAKKRSLSLLEIEAYNYTIYQHSYDQMYSDNEDYLRALVSLDKNAVEV